MDIYLAYFVILFFSLFFNILFLFKCFSFNLCIYANLHLMAKNSSGVIEYRQLCVDRTFFKKFRHAAQYMRIILFNFIFFFIFFLNSYIYEILHFQAKDCSDKLDLIRDFKIYFGPCVFTDALDALIYSRISKSTGSLVNPKVLQKILKSTSKILKSPIKIVKSPSIILKSSIKILKSTTKILKSRIKIVKSPCESSRLPVDPEKSQ